MAAAEQSADGLQALAARIRPDFRIGAAVALGPLASDADYARELVGNFGALTPENAMKPQFLSPQQGVYTFEEADAILAIAESKGMAVHGHTIAFRRRCRAGCRSSPAGSEQERRASAEALLDYVTTVVTHFKGRLDSLDVVNEPFDVDQGTSLQQNIWYRVFGPSYPAVVSQAVYDADPDVKQFINENGADVPGPRQDALLKLAPDTNALGGHIYGVGLQAHVYDLETDAISADDLSQTLDHFEDGGAARPHLGERRHGRPRGRTPRPSSTPRCWPPACARAPASPTRRGAWTTATTGGSTTTAACSRATTSCSRTGKPTPAYEAIKRALGG